MPRAAIVIPAHNRADLLRITLHNACRQTERDLEIFVVNDHSEEDIEGVVAEQNDPRVHYRMSDGKGASAARNLGIRESMADYLVLLDSDDLLHPEMITRLSESLDKTPELDLAVAQMAHFSDDPMKAELLWNTFDPAPFPGKQKTPTARFLAHEPVWGIHGPLWRRKTLVEIGALDASLPLAQDYELHARALAMGKQAWLVPSILTYCRAHQAGSISSDATFTRQRILMGVFENLAKVSPSIPEADEIFRGNFLWIAAFAADGGIADLANQALAKANPSGFNGFLFRIAMKARLLTGRHPFHVQMHAIAKKMGHDLDSRIDWRKRHRITDEPNLEWPPLPEECWRL